MEVYVKMMVTWTKLSHPEDGESMILSNSSYAV
jgi:hypothetical protein